DKINDPTKEEREAEEEMIALKELLKYEEELRLAEEKGAAEEREAEEEKEAVGELIKYEKALKIAEESKTTESLGESERTLESCPSKKLSCDSAGGAQIEDGKVGNASSPNTSFILVDRGVQVDRSIDTSCPHCGHDMQEDTIPRKSTGTQTDDLVVGEGVTAQGMQMRDTRRGSQDSDETFYEPAERDRVAAEGIQRVAAWQMSQSSDETLHEPAGRGRKRTLDSSNIYLDKTTCSPSDRVIGGAENAKNFYLDETMGMSVKTEILFEEGPGSIFSDVTVCMSDVTMLLVKEEEEEIIFLNETICASPDRELIVKEERDEISFLGGICFTSSQREFIGEDEKPIYLGETCCTPTWMDWKPAEGGQEHEKKNAGIAEKHFDPPEKKRSKTEIRVLRDSCLAGPSGAEKTFSPAKVGGGETQQNRWRAGWVARKTGDLKLKFMRAAKKGRIGEEENRNIVRSPSPGHVCALPRCELHQPFYVSSNRELMRLPENVRPMARRHRGKSPEGFWSLDMP
ncbi:Proprotein convertase subtilisin/kexin type 4, partial [Frankliniella fusca]